MKCNYKFFGIALSFCLFVSVNLFAFPEMAKEKSANGKTSLEILVEKISKEGEKTPVKNVKVTLQAFEMKPHQESAKKSRQYAGITSSKGVAMFRDLPVRNDLFYEASVTQNATEFKSDLVVLSEPKAQKIGIAIFEISDSADSIKILKKHVIIDSYAGDYDKKMLKFSEVLIIQNESNLIFRPKSKSRLQIGIPQKVQNVNFEFGMNASEVIYLEGDDFFSLLTDIYPGHENMRNIGINYAAELKDDIFNFSQKLKLPVDSTVILLGTDKLDISGPEIQFSGEKSFGNKVYRQFQADNLKRDDIFKFDIRLRTKNVNIKMIIVIAFLALIAIFAISSLFIWRKNVPSQG